MAQKHFEKLFQILKLKHLRLVTAESCTGGLVAAAITEIPGSSDIFDRGFVTYSNESKVQLLSVPATHIKKHGAVSKQVAMAMAKGAIKHSQADVSVAITGIAGPGGGNTKKPVGLVYIATAYKGEIRCAKLILKGNRSGIRRQAIEKSVEFLLARIR